MTANQVEKRLALNIQEYFLVQNLLIYFSPSRISSQDLHPKPALHIESETVYKKEMVAY